MDGSAASGLIPTLLVVSRIASARIRRGPVTLVATGKGTRRPARWRRRRAGAQPRHRDRIDECLVISSQRGATSSGAVAGFHLSAGAGFHLSAAVASSSSPMPALLSETLPFANTVAAARCTGAPTPCINTGSSAVLVPHTVDI
ncbi:unnamed protein product [Urochloa humidicola]